jgi:hypothetical protein
MRRTRYVCATTIDGRRGWVRVVDDEREQARAANGLQLLRDTIAATIKMTEAWAAIPEDAEPAERAGAMVRATATAHGELKAAELRAAQRAADSLEHTGGIIRPVEMDGQTIVRVHGEHIISPDAAEELRERLAELRAEQADITGWPEEFYNPPVRSVEIRFAEFPHQPDGGFRDWSRRAAVGRAPEDDDG